MKRIYNVVIIDDDQASIDNLVACLNSFQMLEIAGTARNGHLGKKIIAKNKPDLLFLDMELTDMSGIDMFNEIKMKLIGVCGSSYIPHTTNTCCKRSAKLLSITC